MAKDKICAVILAAGFSSRMGDFKPMLSIGGIPAIEMLVRSFEQAGIDKIIIVTGHRREFLKDILSGLNAAEAYNEDFAQGMFSSIKTGLKAAFAGASDNSGTADTLVESDSISGILLAPVDCPLVPCQVIKSIALEHKKRPDALIVPCYLGKKGHPLLIPTHLTEEALAYEGDQGLKGVTRRYEEEMIRIETDCEAVVLDMDTPEGYREILDYHDNQHKILSGEAKPFNLKEALSGRRLFLVRHGEIRQHSEKIFLGQHDAPLSEKGKSQAKAAADELTRYAVTTDTIFSSDLCRATETAEIIADALCLQKSSEKIADTSEAQKDPAYDVNIKPITVTPNPGLREMALGAWDGRFISEIKALYPDAYKKRGENLLGFKFDNGSENFYDLQYRVIKCMENIVRNYPEGDLVIVAHSGVIKVMLSYLNDVPLVEGIMRKIGPGEIS